MGRLLKLLFGFFLWGLFLQSYGFFEIVEVMPNTTDDKNLEYITLKNTSDAAQSLSGYTLSDKKKQYVFPEDILLEAGEKKQFFRPETKLVLNNSNEQIFLHNPDNELVDEIEYASSTKGNFLTFESIDSHETDETISAETRIAGSVLISDEAPAQEHSLEVPEIVFSLQRPSYITQSGSTDIYFCDNKQDECKVNFDLRNSFSPDMPERDYVCSIDFGLADLTGQEGRCNPNTIIFPEGEVEVIFKIFHGDDVNIFSEKKISVKNIQDIPSLSRENGEDPIEEFIRNIYISSPQIIVQSGLTGQGRYFYCEKAECKINLNYTKRHKDERCYWNFAHNEQSSESTHTRCNPGYVTVPHGSYEMSLKVYEKGNERNRKITRFYVYNLGENMQPLSLEKGENLERVETRGESELQDHAGLQISLQGKMSKEKTFSGNTLVCGGVERCYVNLEGIITGGDKAGLEYIWTLDGETFSEKLNPKGIWIEGIGKHEIIFLVGDLQEILYVNILQNAALLSSKGEEIQRGGEGSKTQKQKKIKFTQNFFVLKYDGLRISGTAPAGSKIEIYNRGEKVGETLSDAKGKYRFVSKNFKVGEYSFDTKIILDSGEEIFLENSENFELVAEKREFWFVVKKKTTSKKKSSRLLQSTKIPSLILQETLAKDIVASKPEEMSLAMKIFLLAMICMCGVLALLHIIIYQIPPIVSHSLRVYRLRFTVKSQVLLCL